MSPSFVTIDNTPDIDFAADFNPAPTKQTKNGIANTTTTHNRTLLLAPPSIAAQGTSALPTFDRETTDLQMLDRLYAGLVTLPAATYDLVLLLTDSDGARHAEATGLLSRAVFASLVSSMKPGASLRTQDGRFDPSESREAVLAGLVQKDGGYEKVEEEEVVVPLRFGKKKTAPAAEQQQKTSNGNGIVHSSAGPAVGQVTIDVAGRPKTLDMVPPAVKPVAGVGFDFGDDLDDDDELIDEDELMTEEDLNRPVQMRMLPPVSTNNAHTRTLSVPHMLTPQPGHSPGVQARARQEAPRMQGLHLRPGGAHRGAGQGPPCQGGQRPQHPQAQVRGPQRAGLHGPGQDGELRQLLPRRRVPLLRLPLHRAPALQARRGGHHPEQRGPVLSEGRGRPLLFGASENDAYELMYTCVCPPATRGHAGRRGGHVGEVLFAAGDIIERLVCNRQLLSKAVQASSPVV